MSSKIDFKEIEKIIKLVEDKKLAEFELEIEGFKIKIVRNIPSPIPEVIQTQKSQTLQKEKEIPKEVPQAEENNLFYVKSPIVGTFYRAPDPSSPPYVEEGDKIEKNQVLCIIEAMKLMNEIEAEVEGIVEKIYVQNGEPVEYGQKLFAIRIQK